MASNGRSGAWSCTDKAFGVIVVLFSILCLPQGVWCWHLRRRRRRRSRGWAGHQQTTELTTGLGEQSFRLCCRSGSWRLTCGALGNIFLLLLLVFQFSLGLLVAIAPPHRNSPLLSVGLGRQRGELPRRRLQILSFQFSRGGVSVGVILLGRRRLVGAVVGDCITFFCIFKDFVVGNFVFYGFGIFLFCSLLLFLCRRRISSPGFSRIFLV